MLGMKLFQDDKNFVNADNPVNNLYLDWLDHIIECWDKPYSLLLTHSRSLRGINTDLLFNSRNSWIAVAPLLI